MNIELKAHELIARTYLMLCISIATDIAAVVTLPFKQVVMYSKIHSDWTGAVIEIGTFLVVAILTVSVVGLLSVVQNIPDSISTSETDEELLDEHYDNLHRGVHLYTTSLIMYIVVEAILRAAL
jgi:cytochrome b